MHDRGDRGRGRGFDGGGGGGGGREADRQRTPEEESTERVYRVWQEIDSASQRVERLSAITQREEWRTERKTLQQTHDTLVERVQERELDAKASARAQEHYTNATKKLGDITAALASAQEPLRPVPPVAGEEAIEPSILARSAVPDDVLAWVAGLDASQRAAISKRVKDVLTSVQRIDKFAVDLANYLGVNRMLSQFDKVADNPRKHFNPAAYAKARARREAADAQRADASASRTAAAPTHNPQARPADQKTAAAPKGAAPPASQVGGATTAKPTASARPSKQAPSDLPDPSSMHALPGLPDPSSMHAAPSEPSSAMQLQPTSTPQHGTSAGGMPLPPDVRAEMEHALGADFSAVRVHQDGQAEAAGALAFTRGADIHFAPGRYDPYGSAGRQLLGHELTHAAQQTRGRVAPTAQVNGQAINDDPALEQEAESKGALAASTTGSAAAPTTPARPAAAGPLQAKAAPPTPDALNSAQPMTSEVTADLATVAPIQRQRDEHKPKKQHIPYRIQITRPMTAEEFKVAAHLQVFGAVIASDWHNVKGAYAPADSPVEILVGVELFHRGRGLANAARGIETDATGAVVGGQERAKDFQSAPASDEKTALLAEIDRRYYAASGAAAGAKIKPGELGRAELWRTIRDEVLFQGAYLANLPEKVRAVIRVSITGRELAPTDYDQLFRITKKIENLPPGQAADYASKVTAQGANLDELEAAIERYRGGVAAREHQDGERAEVHNKLLGLEEVYKLYRAYRATPAEAMAPDAREQLEQQLRRNGFASIGEFTSYIAKYEQAFEDGAAAITLDILAKYAGKLHRESQRYQDPEVVKTLHGKLGGFRAQYQELDKNSKIWSAEAWKAQHTRDAEVRRLPGNGGIPEKPPTRELVEAKQKAETAKASAEAQVKDLSKEYPIFAEDELPTDKRLDKVALAQASETELAGVLQAHIAHRQTAVADARGHLEGKHELIYKMPKLMPTFYAQMGIQQGSIHDQIIQDKMHSDAVAKVVTGIIVAIVTVALTVVSLGTATPAVLAAGASIGAAGISTYMAYDEYQQYTEDHAIAEAGFANDPSVTWLVLAIVGAGADMASAVRVISKLAPAAKALEAEGKLIDFTKAVEALQRSKEIDEKIAAAADKAAAARTSYAAAKEQFKADLKMAASGARGALGPFTDPTVFRGLVKMAIAKLREGMNSLEVFIEQLKKARIEAQLGEMSPEELAKAKEAWAQADGLTKQINDPAKLDNLLALNLEPGALEKFADLDVAALQKFAALGPEELQKFARLRYADMLAKFGACDAEGLAKLATLDRAVLEKFGGWDARTIKNISGLEMPNIERIAQLKVAPGQAVEGALSGFHSEQFHMGSEVFQLDKRGMAHVLERHHPQYWDGSVKVEQSFLDPRMTASDVQDAIRAVMKQNRDLLMKRGTHGAYRMTGTYDGRTYVLGVTDGRVGQFYPK